MRQFRSYLWDALETFEKRSAGEDTDFVPRLNVWLDNERQFIALVDSPGKLPPDSLQAIEFSHVLRTDCSIPEGPATLVPKIKPSYSNWTVSVSGKPCKGQKITVTFTGKPDKGWHLFSSDASGEIAYLATEFQLDDDLSRRVKLSGGMKDLAPPHSENDEIMGGILRSYSEGKSASFSQDFLIQEAGACVAGILKAQICMESGMCIMFSADFRWHPPASECE